MKQESIEEHVKNTLNFYSKLSPYVCNRDNVLTSDNFTNDCIKKLGINNEEDADEIFAVVYNYIFGLENTENDLNKIIEIIKEIKVKEKVGGNNSTNIYRVVERSYDGQNDENSEYFKSYEDAKYVFDKKVKEFDEDHSENGDDAPTSIEREENHVRYEGMGFYSDEIYDIELETIEVKQ